MYNKPLSLTLVLSLAAGAALAQDTITFTSFGGSYQEAQRNAQLDPVSNIPEYKVCAIKLSRAA